MGADDDSDSGMMPPFSLSNNLVMRADTMRVYVDPVIECHQPSLATEVIVIFFAIGFGVVLGRLMGRGR